VKFRVWAAPSHVTSVSLLLNGSQRVPMHRDSARGDWWTADVEAAPDTRYQFILDDGEPVADPRSPHQPEGIFGPSAVVDHAAFRWTDEGWQPPPLAASITYELHIGTFTPGGTFDSAVERLDHLKDLGVTHVEIMPVNEFAGARGWGYDGVFLFAPHHRYGGPEGMKRFVDACHRKGLAVVLDVVYNHFGAEGNVGHRFGPYTTARYKTPWGEAVNLDDAGSDEVRRFLCDNALMWLRDYHCDALRIDAIHAFADTTALPFLEQLALETDALSAHLGRSLTLIAESALNDPRVVRSRDAGGFGLHAHWNDDFHHAVHVTLTGEQQGYYADFKPFRDIGRALTRGYVYEGQYSVFRERSHGRPALLSGNQLVSFLQNHDQVGNRADGTRLSQLISLARCRAAAALLFTSPFLPLLFQGEEWGARTPFPYFCDHQDPAIIEATREGRRKEFERFGFDNHVPDPQALETFNSARLCWDELTIAEHAEMLAWYRRLIALRSSEPDLVDGRLDRCEIRHNDGWLVVKRGRVEIACNLGDAPAAVPLAPFHGTAVLAKSGDIAHSESSITLGPDAVIVLRR
jgi:maltooligosyltrehalose trehalohydrolase